MEILVKVGDKREVGDFMRSYDWLDGQIISIRPDGYYKGTRTRKSHCVVSTQHDYKILIGYDTAKEAGTICGAKWLDLKKYISPYYNDKNKWDAGYTEPRSFASGDARKRDWFIDFKWMLQQGWITQKQYDSIYNKKEDHNLIYIDRDISTYIFNEDSRDRVEKTAEEIAKSVGTIQEAGTYTIGNTGAGDPYDDWSDAEADLPADLDAMTTTPGSIVLQGNTTEEIVEAAGVTFTLDCGVNSYSLKCTVHANHKHNGGAYGSGHRISLTGYDEFEFDVASGGIGNFTVEDLAFSCTGTNTRGVYFEDDQSTSALASNLVQRCVMVGDANSSAGVIQSGNYDYLVVRNNVCYGFTGSGDSGMLFANEFTITTSYVMNNTCCKNDIGITNGGASTPFVTNGRFQNNLCYGNNSADFDCGAEWPTYTQNVSGDATSPNNKDNWVGTANMEDYANNDFRLKTTDTTLDDGDNLSAIGSPEQFSDDIEDQARSTWYIGASELPAAGGANAPTGNIYGPLAGPLGGVT